MLKLPARAAERIRCPVCHGALRMEQALLGCTTPSCALEFPVLGGIPVLINEANSLFSRSDYVGQRRTTYDLQEPAWKRAAKRWLPRLDKNVAARRNLSRLAELLLQMGESPLILVVGGRTVGEGMEVVVGDPRFQLVESDVSFGPRTSLITDAHDIPFEDGTFDAVVAQAVLEHVLDPFRCVAEIRRVLKPKGLVYAETPFMQQVHGGRYDFTRFTQLGHRRLFREFEEIESGAVCGPGMALGWAYQHFLLSFARKRWQRMFVLGFARLTAFYLKYFDTFLINRPGALDAASGVFFMGMKSERPLPDRELVQHYHGAAYL